MEPVGSSTLSFAFGAGSLGVGLFEFI
jgi:hypothetical protein